MKKALRLKKPEPPHPMVALHPVFNINVEPTHVTVVVSLPDYLEQILAALIGAILGVIVLAFWLG